MGGIDSASDPGSQQVFTNICYDYCSHISRKYKPKAGRDGEKRQHGREEGTEQMGSVTGLRSGGQGRGGAPVF